MNFFGQRIHSRQILLVLRLETGAPDWIHVWIPLFVWEFFNLLSIIGSIRKHWGPPANHDPSDEAPPTPVRE